MSIISLSLFAGLFNLSSTHADSVENDSLKMQLWWQRDRFVDVRLLG